MFLMKFRKWGQRIIYGLDLALQHLQRKNEDGMGGGWRIQSFRKFLITYISLFSIHLLPQISGLLIFLGEVCRRLLKMPFSYKYRRTSLEKTTAGYLHYCRLSQMSPWQSVASQRLQGGNDYKTPCILCPKTGWKHYCDQSSEISASPIKMMPQMFPE